MKRKLFSGKVCPGPPSPFLLQVIGLEGWPRIRSNQSHASQCLRNISGPLSSHQHGFLGHRCLGRAQLLPTCASFETSDLAQMTAGFFPLCFTDGDKRQTVTHLAILSPLSGTASLQVTTRGKLHAAP